MEWLSDFSRKWLAPHFLTSLPEQSWQELLAEDCLMLETSLSQALLATEKEKQAHRLFTASYHTLLQVSNTLFEKYYALSAGSLTLLSSPTSERLLFSCQQLDSLLSLLVSRFPSLTSAQLPLSYFAWHLASQQLQEKSKAIAFLLPESLSEHPLLTLALYPAYSLPTQPVSLPDQPVSLSHLSYLTRYFEYLYAWAQALPASVQSADFEQALLCRLILLNFNHLPVLDYYTHALGQLTEPTPALQAERLCLHLKTIRQQAELPGMAYEPHQPSLKSWLSEWLCEEITFCEQKARLVVASQTSDFKIQTSLSVSQLAYFFRLTTDSGIITNSNLRELLSFAARHLSTRHTGNVSAESLRIKFYDTESGTKASLKDLLQKMLDTLKKENPDTRLKR
jgi:hypothetical protein